MYSIVLLGVLTAADGAAAFPNKCYPPPVFDGHGWPGNHSHGGWGRPYGGYAWPGYSGWGCGEYGVPMSPLLRPEPFGPYPDDDKDKDENGKDKDKDENGKDKEKDKKKNGDGKDDKTPKKNKKKPDDDTDISTTATVTFLLPKDARLYVDGKPITNVNGTTFRTPTLQAGQRYFYEVRAEVVRNGKPVTRTRQVILTPGASIQADFRDMVEKGVAAR